MKKIIKLLKALLQFPIYPYKIYTQINRLLLRHNYLSHLQSSRIEAKLYNPDYKPRSIVLVVVMILRENILFLDEWLEHHFRLGIDHVDIYIDKEKNKNNFYGINYKDLITLEETDKKFKEILDKYKGKISVSYPEDIPNIYYLRNIDHYKVYGEYIQTPAYDYAIFKNKYLYEYALFIDCDEFMISRNNLSLKDIIINLESSEYSSAFFNSRYFESRFKHLDKKVLEITVSTAEDWTFYSHKTMFKLSAFNNEKSEVHIINTHFNGKYIDCNDMFFHHYNLNEIKSKNLLQNGGNKKDWVVQQDLLLAKGSVENKDSFKYLDPKNYPKLF